MHTDRGAQFRPGRLVSALTRHELVGSIGRVGSASDNAAMESFFSLLQKNVLNRQTWTGRDELCLTILFLIHPTTAADDKKHSAD